MTEQFRIPTKLFDLGRVVATPGANALDRPFLRDGLTRHVQGDWGCVNPDDHKANFDALSLGNRLLSAYAIDPTKPSKGHGTNTLWIITEADRSLTTLLLSDEYRSSFARSERPGFKPVTRRGRN